MEFRDYARAIINIGALITCLFLGWNYVIGVIVGFILCTMTLFFPDSIMRFILSHFIDFDNSEGVYYVEEYGKQEGIKNSRKVKYKKQ